jgi:hypothetical protein
MHRHTQKKSIGQFIVDTKKAMKLKNAYRAAIQVTQCTNFAKTISARIAFQHAIIAEKRKMIAVAIQIIQNDSHKKRI